MDFIGPVLDRSLENGANAIHGIVLKLIFRMGLLARLTITRGIMKCPIKHVKDVFLKCPKFEQFYFRFISHFKTTC